ncbi:MAG TPA: ABC transporter substrate-binding protein [Streptosporangiaceae bacterium]|nr:ABC transporter substrate-binding protein [Streptosporangiaceae bacterium]
MPRPTARWRRRRAAACLALCGGLVLGVPAVAAAAPAGAAAATSGPGRSATFVVGNDGAVDGLNPFVGQTSIDFEVYGLIYDNLMDYGQTNYQPAPRLATSWSVSANQLVWTYHIRHGVYWSDGVPLTAADVAYTFWRDTIPNSVEFADNSAYVANIVHSSVKAIGRYTVQMTVTKPTPNMDLLIVPILPKHIWDHVSEKDLTTFANNHPVGTGPFRVSQFTINQSVTLMANPHYWGGRPGISTLIFQNFTNPSAEAIALKNGSIDFAEGLTYPLFNSLKGAKGVTLDNAPSGNFDELSFNNGAATVTGKKIGNGNPALLDINVRHAITYAIDQKELVRRVFLGDAEPATSVIPPIYPQYYYRPAAGTAYSYDQAKADAILTADGWKMGPGGIRVKDGRQLSLRLFYPSGSPTYNQDAPYIKAWLNAVGIGVTVTEMSTNTLTQVIGNGDYDMFIWGWGVEPNPDFQLSVFTCAQRSSGSPPNYTPGWSDNFFCDKRYDQLYEAQKSVGGAARGRIVQQMQQILYTDDPYSVLYYYNDDQAYRSDLFTGFAPQPDKPNGLVLFQEVSWWSYRCMRPVGTSPSLTDRNVGCQHETGMTRTAVAAAAGPPTGAGVVGIGALAAIVLGIAGVLVARRRAAATAYDRE